jgi:PAS domain S-box-containing protein
MGHAMHAARSNRPRWTTPADPGAVVGRQDFESAALAIHVVSAAGLIVEVNRAFEIMFGASRRLYLGKHSAVLGADPIAAGLRLLDVIRGGVIRHGVWRGTMQNERFNGTAFRSRTHVWPMRVGGRGYQVFFQEEVRAAMVRAPVVARGREQVLTPVT